MANTWEVSKDEFHTAFNGVLLQAKVHGLDTTDEKIHAFILHQAEVIASKEAGMRFYCNALNIGE